jgi:hypothetical protein
LRNAPEAERLAEVLAAARDARIRRDVDQAREPVVLYDGSVDTGYFVFFVRKHDPRGRLVRLTGVPPAREDSVPAPTITVPIPPTAI